MNTTPETATHFYKTRQGTILRVTRRIDPEQWTHLCEGPFHVSGPPAGAGELIDAICDAHQSHVDEDQRAAYMHWKLPSGRIVKMLFEPNSEIINAITKPPRQ